MQTPKTFSYCDTDLLNFFQGKLTEESHTRFLDRLETDEQLWNQYLELLENPEMQDLLEAPSNTFELMEKIRIELQLSQQSRSSRFLKAILSLPITFNTF
jgi:hypothetical protein